MTTPDASDENKLKQIFYNENKYVGRDSLFFLLKKRFPNTHPSKEFIEQWLNKQELQQLHRQTRRSSDTDSFRPSRPWQNISMDLMDFQFKSAPNARYKYVLHVLDNFSRFSIVRGMPDKTSATTAKYLKQILDEIKNKFNDPDIKNIITDDGNEFKKDTTKLLKDRGIGIRRALGGNPQQNGLVEKKNFLIKRIMQKTVEVKGGSWFSHLQQATATSNEAYHRALKTSSAEAVRLPPDEQEEIKQNIKKTYEKRRRAAVTYREGTRFRVGDTVRIKLNKTKLSKGSDPNWSKRTYTVGSVIPKQGTRAEKYKLIPKFRVSGDTIFTRTDLQLIDLNTLEKIPERRRTATPRRTRSRRTTTSSPPTRRVTRSQSKKNTS